MGMTLVTKHIVIAWQYIKVTAVHVTVGVQARCNASVMEVRGHKYFKEGKFQF